MTTTDKPGGLRRTIGFWGLTALAFNGVVGAGVLALPGSAATYAGGWAPLVIALVAIGLLPVVMVFGRLATFYDATGGPVLYARDAFGITAGFQVGWMQCLSSTASGAANCNVLADYVLKTLPPESVPPIARAVIVVAAVAALWIAIADVRRADAVLRTATLLKLAPLIAVAAAAAPFVSWEGLAAARATDWSLPKAVTLAAYAFVGFEVAVTSAGEALSPERDMPRAMPLAFAGVAAVYVALVATYVCASFVTGVKDDAPLAGLAERGLGPVGVWVAVVLAVVSILGNLVTVGMAVSRRLYALSEMRTLPGWFSRIEATSRAPRNAQRATVLVMLLLALSGGFVVLATLAAASRVVVYSSSVASWPVIARRAGKPSPLWLLIPAAGACLILAAAGEARSWIGVGIAALAGFALLALARRRANAEAATT